MECMSCDSTKPMVVETVTHKYKECGLDNVTLVGIQKLKCENCGEEHFHFGNVDELHKIIADFLIKKDSLLTGKEMRFLRTRMGYSGEMLGKVLGYDKDHLYKVESGKIKITESMDRFMRFAFMNKMMPDRYYDLHDSILTGSGLIHIDTLRFQQNGETWEKAA